MKFFTAELILASVALLGCIGGGLKYLISRFETERTRFEAERVKYELKVDQERIRHEKLFAEQLAELRREVRLQEHEVSHLRVMSAAYLQHIAALEALMRAAGVQIPELRLPACTPPAVANAQ